MVDLKAKLRAKFARRHSGLGSFSTESSTASSNAEAQPKASLVSISSGDHVPGSHSSGANQRASGDCPVSEFEKKKARSTVSRSSNQPGDDDEARLQPILDSDAHREQLSEEAESTSTTKSVGAEGTVTGGILEDPRASDMSGNDLRPFATRLPSIHEQSALAAIDASDSAVTDSSAPADAAALTSANDSASATDEDDALLAKPHASVADAPTAPRIAPVIPATPTPTSEPSTAALRPPSLVSRPSGPQRRQSLLPNRQTTLIRTLLTSDQADDIGFATNEQLLPLNATMVTRKIWVRRPGASATLVTINEDDLVDDVRDMILRKYGNSLGRQFDAPDITLRIVPREKRMERTLGPEEPMSRTLDAYYPGGQSVDEALVIDVPLGRRTPRASPRTGPPHASHLTSVYYDEVRPSDAATDYFGPNVGPAMPVTVTAPLAAGHAPHTISVLNTGQVPQIPSPGGTRARNYRERPDRPRLGRTHTSSPTIIGVGGGHPASLAGAAASHSIHEQSGGPPPPAPPPMPTPPAGTDLPNVPSMLPIQRTSTPPPRQASPRPLVPQQSGMGSTRPRKKKSEPLPTPLPAGVLNSGVPPINVLIVEDNIINLKLLEAFVKRLKVRWATAMNGREAVTKWRAGGFHLVLMDIQLPIMSGLDATREIRRLERVNSIGVFSGSAGDAVAAAGKAKADVNPEDKFTNPEVFKSPVIIVALTASSLQSDRHEALAAGCNDFLTKPVNFVWLERKVMEWGCMQALIDYDGWRKWKDFSHTKEETEAAKKPSKTKKTKNRLSFTSPA